jgi:hypothetical protein
MINLPGFTAEVTLYEQTRHYHAAHANPRGSYGVNLAQLLTQSVGCYQSCLAECGGPGDSLCVHDCHCSCFGKPCPGRGCNCWLI